MIIQLKKEGIYAIKSMQTLVIASSCIDNITAITGFSLLVGIIFNKSNLKLENKFVLCQK